VEQDDALLPLLISLTLECAVRKVKKREESELVRADDVGLPDV
jgi:hypothetical protein